MKHLCGREIAGFFAAGSIASLAVATQAQTFETLKSFGFLTNKVGTVVRSSLVQAPDGTLYGTTSAGGGIMRGTVFKVATNGSGFTLLRQFTNLLDGAFPKSSLLLDGGTIYGTTTAGGAEAGGTIFKLNVDGTGFTILESLPAGSYNRNLPPPPAGGGSVYESDPPMGGLALAGSTLYGTTRSGGALAMGTVFKIATNGTGYAVIKEFSGTNGAAPTGDLVESAGIVYGTTSGGGNSNTGTVFKVSIDGSSFTVLKHFSGPDGAQPYAGLILSAGTLYGVTVRGGAFTSQAGTVFKINTDGNGFAVLKSFNASAPPNGIGPMGRLTLAGNVLYGTAASILNFTPGIGTVFRLNTDGSGFGTVFYGLGGPGSPLFYSQAGVVVSGNTVYGTITTLSSSAVDEVFSMNTNGTGRTTLRRFDNSSGDASSPGPVILVGENLYGVGSSGGTSNAGAIFRIHTNGSGYTVLKSLNGASEGSSPATRLVTSSNTLYGTARLGGAASSGTIFKISTNGTGFTVLRAMSEAANPAGLVLANDVLYGAAESGGTNGNGAVYKINTDGNGFSILKDFASEEGGGPDGELTLVGSTLYGTTTYSGAFGLGNIFKIDTSDSGFLILHSFDYDEQLTGGRRLTLAGDTLYCVAPSRTNSFMGSLFHLSPDGSDFGVTAQLADSRLGSSFPSRSGLVAGGAILYGASAGSTNNGALFQIQTNGSNFAVVNVFGPLPDGAQPNGDLVLAGHTLYGTTTAGGECGEGTIFRLDLRPRLTIVRASSTVTVSWPSYAADYQLEQQSSVASNTWSNVNNPVSDDGTNRAVALPAPAGTNGYLRLRK